MFFSLLALIIVIINTIFIYIGYKTTKDLFSPLCLFNILYIVKHLRLFTFEFNVYEKTVVYSDYHLFLFSFIILTYMLSVNSVLCIKIINQRFPNLPLLHSSFRFSNNTILLLVFVCLTLTLCAYTYLVCINGGIINIWENIHLRAAMLRGNTYLSATSDLAIICVLIVNMMYNKYHKKYLKILYGITLIITSIILVIFGARKPLIEFIILLMFSHNYFIKPIAVKSLFKAKTFAFIFILALFIVGMPLIRDINNRDLIYSPGEWIISATKSLDSLTRQVGTVDADFFVYHYFSENSFWYGAAYRDLIYAFVPSKIFLDKPPVDDGVYMMNLIHGHDLKPSVPFKSLPVQYSQPFTNSSVAFANWGIIGVVFYGIAIAIIYDLFYSKLRKQPNIFNMIIYQTAIVSFAFTNLAIVAFVIKSFYPYLFSKILINHNTSKGKSLVVNK